MHGEPLLREGYSDRILVVGPTSRGRILAIVLEPLDDDSYYVVTARPADRKERKLYETRRGGEEE